jgi:hypothetical protein
MPLLKLQEIIIDYAQHLFMEGRFLALQFSMDYPYKKPVFAFNLEGERLEFIDNTQKPATMQDGRKITKRADYCQFRKPKCNQVKAAFLKFRYWESKILTNNDHADPNKIDQELEIIAGKLLPFAVAILKSTAESYALLDPSSVTAQDTWTHPACDLTCQAGMLESGESVPAEIQVKVEEFNDHLREMQRRITRTRAIISQSALSISSEASEKIVRLFREIIVDYAGEMVLAGQRNGADANAQYPSVPVMKEDTIPFPVPVSSTQESTGDAAILKVKNRKSDISEAFSEDEENPQHNRRNEQLNSRKAKTIQYRLLTEAERRQAVEAYIAEVFEKTGKRITRADIWKSARYKDRTDFERWQRNDPKATGTANERFTRVLKEKPHLK